MAPYGCSDVKASYDDDDDDIIMTIIKYNN